MTGAASGIGAAVAERLAADGFAVALIDRAAGQLQALAERLRETHEATVLPLAVDVRDEPALAEALAAAARQAPLRALVTCAGIAGRQLGVREIDTALVREVLEVNLLGTMSAIKHATPHIAAAGGGSITCVASAGAYVGTAQRGVYMASKGAVLAFARCAAVELAAEGIRVNTVSPGAVDTPMLHTVVDDAGGQPHPRGRIDNLLDRLGAPGEIAEAVAFLASGRASFVYGTDLVVDGGKLVQ